MSFRLPPHPQPSCCDCILQRAAESLFPTAPHGTVVQQCTSAMATSGHSLLHKETSLAPGSGLEWVSTRADSADHSLVLPASSSFSLFSLSPHFSLLFFPPSLFPSSLSSPLLPPSLLFPTPEGPALGHNEKVAMERSPRKPYPTTWHLFSDLPPPGT